jgi:photosystem II stability/assembly factor-like uncharacterized protein
VDIWKGNLLRADGWLSRTVIDVAVSSEDPAVVFAVDEGGGLYQSRDGAATWQNWQPIDHSLQRHAVSVDVGSRSRVLVVATTDGFFLSTTAGAQWQPLPVPSEVGQPIDAFFDHTIEACMANDRIGPVSLLQQSFDAGRSWSNTVESLFKLLQGTGLA